MNRKIAISFLVLFLSCLSLLLLSSQTILLSVVLMLLAYAKHKFCPIKKELQWYLFISFGSAMVEIILVNFGGAWKYSAANFFNIPVWMPLFWGVVGTTTIVLYKGMTND